MRMDLAITGSNSLTIKIKDPKHLIYDCPLENSTNIFRNEKP